MNKAKVTTTAFVAGAAAGAVTALLTCPGSGAENRRKVKQAAAEAKHKASATKKSLINQTKRAMHKGKESAKDTLDQAAAKTDQMLSKEQQALDNHAL